MKKLVVLGAQESGVGAALLAKKLGMPVFVSDMRAIKCRKNTARCWMQRALPTNRAGTACPKFYKPMRVVKSPGIPGHGFHRTCIARQGRSSDQREVEFAARLLQGQDHRHHRQQRQDHHHAARPPHPAKSRDRRGRLAGNVGTSFAGLVAAGDNDWYVLELSSFQLDGVKELKPHIAVLTNITPDHLERYNHRMENYADAKFRIAMNQGPEDHFIHNVDDPQTRLGLLRHTIKARQWPFSIRVPIEQGGCILNDNLHITINQTTFDMSILDLALHGKHNTYNSLAAGIVARVLDVRKEPLREALSDFQNVEHRLERVAW
jgi:UDP-N-acetylmuramoylalanine--D-glutamate ligase